MTDGQASLTIKLMYLVFQTTGHLNFIKICNHYRIRFDTYYCGRNTGPQSIISSSRPENRTLRIFCVKEALSPARLTDYGVLPFYCGGCPVATPCFHGLMRSRNPSKTRFCLIVRPCRQPNLLGYGSLHNSCNSCN